MNKDTIYKLIYNLGFPTNLVLDKSGQITFIKCGGHTDKQKAEAYFDDIYNKEIEELLNGKVN